MTYDPTTKKPHAILIGAEMLQILMECRENGVVPWVADGESGRSHSVQWIYFSILAHGQLIDFSIKVTSSYQKFIDYLPFGPGFLGAQMTSIEAIIKKARQAAESEALSRKSSAAAVMGSIGGSVKTAAKAAAARANGAKGGRPRKDQKKGA